MNTLEDLNGMTVGHLKRWSYRTLDIPEETKKLIESAESGKRSEPTVLSGNPDVYTQYMVRTKGKVKGEDLFNDVCSVFDEVKRNILSEEDVCPLAPEKKQEIENCFHALHQIRNENNSPFADVRTVLGSQIPEPWPDVLLTDYNVMVFTVAKLRVDSCRRKNDEDGLCQVLRTHFLEENNIISNCVDIPIVPYIEKKHKNRYFNYLHEAIGAVRALTEAVISYYTLKKG